MSNFEHVKWPIITNHWCEQREVSQTARKDKRRLYISNKSLMTGQFT